MNTEDLVVHNGCHREAIKALDELLPQFQGVPSLALIVETVYPVNRTALVVTAQEEKVLWVLYLVGEQKADHLQVLLTSIDVVT